MKRAVSLFLTLLALALTGCDSGSSSSDSTPELATVRVVNLVPDAPALRVFIEGGLHATLAYMQASAMTPATPQGYRFEANFLPVGSADATDVVPRERIRLRPDILTTVLIVGPTDAADFLVVEDDQSEAITSDAAQIRMVNATSATSALTFYLSGDPDSTSINGLTPITLAFAEVSDALTVDSGDARLLVTRSGSSDLLYDSGPLTVVGGSRAILAMVDYFGPGGTIRGLRIGAQGSSALVHEVLPASIRIANMIADTAEIDLLADGAAVHTDVAFGNLSPAAAIDPGEVHLSVTMAADPLAVLYAVTRQMIPGEERLLVVAGSAGAGEVGALLALDPVRPITATAQVRVINAAPNTGALDAYLLATDDDLADVAPKHANLGSFAASTVSAAPGAYDLVITLTGKKTVLLGPQHVVLEGGGIYTVMVRDAAGGGTPGAIVLADDFTQ